MKKTENLSNFNKAVEIISLKDIFDSIVQSKILILVMTTIFSAVISNYLISSEAEPKYQSSAVVQIGKYNDLEYGFTFLEQRDDIQKEMNSIFVEGLVNDNTKEVFASRISTSGFDLLIFEAIAPSKQKSLISINEMISYIVDNQEKISTDMQRKLVNGLTTEYLEFTNKLAILKLQKDEIINIDLPSVENTKNVELASIRRKIKDINEISLPSVENEMNAELASIQQKIDTINEISLPSVENEMNVELSVINRKIAYGNVSIDLNSALISEDVKTSLTGNKYSNMLNDKNLFYFKALNEEQKIFELENFNDELLYVVASKKIEKLKLQSQIKGFNKLLEFTKVNSVGEQLKLQSIRDELTNSIANIVSIENIDIERLNNSLEIIKLSENIIKKQMQDNEAKKIFFLEPLNYISPSLKGQIVTSEIRGNSKPKLILNAIILSFFLSIFLLIFITILRENIEFTKN